MVRVSARAYIAALVVSGLVCTPVLKPSVAWANGDDFFVPQNSANPVLAYFGHVRDAEGHPIGGAFIYFEVKHPHAYVRAKTFPDGGYSTADLGDYIQAIGGEIDYRQIEIRCLKDGYATTRPPAPATQAGRVPLDIVLTREK
jgi:hypothetical protein